MAHRIVDVRGASRPSAFGIFSENFEASVFGTNRLLESRQSMSALPGYARHQLFCYYQRVIDLNAEIPDGAFDVGIPEQELNGYQIAGPSIDQGRLCASQ
jgi:hypothetical protein